VALVICVAVPVVIAVSVLVGALVVRSRGCHHRDVGRRHGSLGRRRWVVVLDVAPGMPVTVAFALVLAVM
jgi:hypothetical protein